MKTVIVFPASNYGMLVDEELVGCFAECIAKSTPVKLDNTVGNFNVVEDPGAVDMPKVLFVRDSTVVGLEPDTEVDSTEL